MENKVEITPFGHSCVLVDATHDGQTTRILLDPGTLTVPLEPIEGLDAVLVTHSHPDHIDPEQIRRLAADHEVPVYGDAATSRVLTDAGLPEAVIVEEGELDIAGMHVVVSKWQHEEIYFGVPLPTGYGFLMAGKVFAPGDAFAVPEFPVDVLLLPTGAPWMKLSEAIDYLRRVAPRVAIPVHDGGLAAPHRVMHWTLMEKFAPDGTTVRPLEPGQVFMA